MNEYYISRENESKEDIEHYGVLGMKWGVKHDAAKAYSKASAKKIRLENEVAKTRNEYLKKSAKANSGVSVKYRKKKAKADKLQFKADKKKYGFFSNANKAAELQVKADRALYKANKYKHKYEKRKDAESKASGKYARAQRKAERWVRAMDRTFANYDVSKLTSQQTSKGEEVAKKMVAAAA